MRGAVRRFRWSLSVMIIVAAVAGCAPARSAPPIRVGTHAWPGYEPLHLAQDLGLYPSSARVRLVRYGSASHQLRAFRNGSIDAATLTLDEALLLTEDVPDLRVVLVLDTSNGADVVLGRAGLATLADLRGRRVGYEATALGAYMLSRALDVAGMAPRDVKAISMEVDEHERAFLAGSVDAVVTFEPTRSRLLDHGAKILFSSAQIPGEIVDVLVMRRSFSESHAAEVAGLVQGWFETLELIRQNSEDVIRRLGARLHLTPEQTRAALAGLTLPDRDANIRLLGAPNPALRDAGTRLAALMVREGLLQGSPDLNRIIDGALPFRAAR